MQILSNLFFHLYIYNLLGFNWISIIVFKQNSYVLFWRWMYDDAGVIGI
jgi:hypothetical protein